MITYITNNFVLFSQKKNKNNFENIFFKSKSNILNIKKNLKKKNT
jgi:hypothetical protein